MATTKDGDAWAVRPWPFPSSIFAAEPAALLFNRVTLMIGSAPCENFAGEFRSCRTAPRVMRELRKNLLKRS